jgi:hypothetical protein
MLYVREKQKRLYVDCSDKVGPLERGVLRESQHMDSGSLCHCTNRPISVRRARFQMHSSNSRMCLTAGQFTGRKPALVNKLRHTRAAAAGVSAMDMKKIIVLGILY